MKQVVLKFDIKNHGLSTISMPFGATVCKAEFQGGFLRIWATVTVGIDATECHNFEVVATGQEFGNEYGSHVHVATLLQGQFVWHVFEVFL